MYGQLCHFYYLVDQPVADGRIIENDNWFAEWLVGYASVWGKFCNSTDSITPETIYSFNERSPTFRVTVSMIPWNKEHYPSNGVKFPPFTPSLIRKRSHYVPATQAAGCPGIKCSLAI